MQKEQIRTKTELVQTKHNILTLVEMMMAQGTLEPRDLSRYARPIDNIDDPEYVRQDLEAWYRSLGLETITGRPLTLAPCEFTTEEIRDARAQGEIILCVPAEVTREQLGELFRIDSWALHDQLVTSGTESRDFWFKTSMDLTPGSMGCAGAEIRRQFTAEGKVHFSLERYLVFIARMRHLTQQTPDQQYWIWLPHRPYDRSGMLMAGFDRFGTFNVHGWMPQFSASFLGARYGTVAARHRGKR